MIRTARAMPTTETALIGRAEPIATDTYHFVSGKAIKGPYPVGYEVACFAMGCFWGVERLFWRAPDVWVTAVGYAGGFTPNPTYGEVCTGMTGHAEAVRVVFRSGGFCNLLKLFWENHNPTQGMRQGQDIGTQYRSIIFYYSGAQHEAAQRSLELYRAALADIISAPLTTELKAATEFYFAEADHQGYLAKNPAGYCGLVGTGVSCDIARELGPQPSSVI